MRLPAGNMLKAVLVVLAAALVAVLVLAGAAHCAGYQLGISNALSCNSLLGSVSLDGTCNTLVSDTQPTVPTSQPLTASQDWAASTSDVSTSTSVLPANPLRAVHLLVTNLERLGATQHVSHDTTVVDMSDKLLQAGSVSINEASLSAEQSSLTTTAKSILSSLDLHVTFVYNATLARFHTQVR